MAVKERGRVAAMALAGRVEKACVCAECFEWFFNKRPKTETKLLAICNRCGFQLDCYVVEASQLSPKKDRQMKRNKNGKSGKKRQ